MCGTGASNNTTIRTFLLYLVQNNSTPSFVSGSSFTIPLTTKHDNHQIITMSSDVNYITLIYVTLGTVSGLNVCTMRYISENQMNV